MKMPLLFVGHGSPMNAIEDNLFTEGWKAVAASLPRPSAILSVSAHWTTDGTLLNDLDKPRTIYDMYGFPTQLYQVDYQPAGAPGLARQTKMLVSGARIDNSWGIDHGTWSVLRRMYPAADIPVYQMSIDMNKTRREHYETGRLLTALRGQGVLIMGSGNIVHNLARVNWDMASGYPWAIEFDNYIRDRIMAGDHAAVIDYRQAGRAADLAFFTLEHFDPLLYVLGASGPGDDIRVFNSGCVLGAISMTGYVFEDRG